MVANVLSTQEYVVVPRDLGPDRSAFLTGHHMQLVTLVKSSMQ